MNRVILALLLATTLTSTGCVSSMVNDAIDTAEERLYEKFEEQWTPHLLNKVELEMAGFKEAVIERVDKNTQDKLDRLEIDLRDHDANQDGTLQWQEGIGLLREMKKKNDEQGSPFSLWELLLAFAGVYGGGSMVKGGVRMVNKRNGTGDGNATPAPSASNG